MDGGQGELVMVWLLDSRFELPFKALGEGGLSRVRQCWTERRKAKDQTGILYYEYLCSTQDCWERIVRIEVQVFRIDVVKIIAWVVAFVGVEERQWHREVDSRRRRNRSR